jgi:hypothetical protein
MIMKAPNNKVAIFQWLKNRKISSAWDQQQVKQPQDMKYIGTLQENLLEHILYKKTLHNKPT